MLGLIYKEFVLGKRTLLFVSAMVLLLFITLFLAKLLVPEDANTDIISVLTYVSIIFCANIMNGELFTKDERRIWANYAVSLPYSVKGQVKAKYYFLFIINTAVFFLCVMLDYLISVFFEPTTGMEIMAGFMTLMLYFVLNAVEIPFLMRFGTKYGNYVKIIIMLLLFFVGFVYALFGDISMFLGEGEIEDILIKVLEFLMDSEVNAVIIGITPWAVLGLYFISYKLSCKFYLKGVEAYER